MNVGPNALQIAGKMDACLFFFGAVILTLADVPIFEYDAFPVNALVLFEMRNLSLLLVSGILRNIMFSLKALTDQLPKFWLPNESNIC